MTRPAKHPLAVSPITLRRSLREAVTDCTVRAHANRVGGLTALEIAAHTNKVTDELIEFMRSKGYVK